MPGRLSFAPLVTAALLCGCATTTAPISNPLASASLTAADGAGRGTATLRSTDGKVELRIAAQDLPAGPHGIHLHAVGRCEAPVFASAGPHLNPHARMHGTDNPRGSHLGDLPNLTAEADGKGAVAVTLPGSQGELEQQLFDGDGTSLVIHATTDDYRTDPSGNSGGRIACGVITRG